MSERATLRDRLAAGRRTGPPQERAGERLRVAFCIDNMQVGGTELNAVRTAERLDPSRYELCVVCLQAEGPLSARYADAGIPVHSIPIDSLYGYSTLRQGWRLARFLRDARIQVFHTHDIYSNIFGVPWARLAGTPLVLASRRWWDLAPTGAHRIANRFAHRFAHRVVANTPEIAKLLEAEGVPSNRVCVVPNFVDDAAFTLLAAEERAGLLHRFGIPAQARLVGMIANLRRVKDHATLLHAFAEIAPRWADTHLVLVGDGGEKQSLRQLAGQTGIAERTHFLGQQPNVPNLHALFDISVLCSLSEGLSNSILEAMAAGTPVVATAVGGNVDAVTDGVTGLLVPPGEPRRLAGAVEEMLGDDARRRRIGSAARNRALEVYSAGSALGALERLYGHAVRERCAR